MTEADRQDLIDFLESIKPEFTRQGSFYPQCEDCGITNVQASIDGRHYEGCSHNRIIYFVNKLKGS